MLQLVAMRRGALAFAASHGVALVLGLGSSVLLARAAPPPTVATYLLLLQAATAASVVLQLGLAPAVLRFAPATRGAGGREASALLRRRLLLLQGLVWAAAAPPLLLAWPWIARRLGAPELAGAGGMIVGLAALFALGQIADAYLRAFRRYGASAALKDVVPRLVLLCGWLALLWRFRGDAAWPLLAAAYVAARVVALLGYAIALRGTSGDEESEPRAAHPSPALGSIFATALVMGLRGAAGILLVSADLWILSALRSHDEVAVYGMMTRLLQVVALSPLIAAFVIPQEFALLHADGRREELERLARTAATAVTVLAAVALAGLVVLGKPFIRLAFGESYVAGWTLILVLGAGRLWDAFAGAAGFMLQMTGHHARLLLLTLGAALLNLGLALLLAPRWGPLGVAAASALCLALFNLAAVWSVRRLLGISTMAYLSPVEWRRALAQLLPAWRRAAAPR